MNVHSEPPIFEGVMFLNYLQIVKKFKYWTQLKKGLYMGIFRA